jgi:phosphopantetheine--protein transferase-like protein
MSILPIGNDIIDASFDTSPSHSRFVERVLSPRELARYEAAADRQQLLHKAWTAKEAAYKYMKQIKPETIFAHSTFEYDEERGLVVYQREREIAVHHVSTAAYLYCHTVLRSREPAFHRIMRLTSSNGPADNPSLKVRELAQEMIAKLFDLERNEISFGKSAAGVPFARVNHNILDIGLTFTHHGSFVAVGIRTHPA